MATQYPQMMSSETLSLAERAHQADVVGIGARMMEWLQQAYCGLHGHDSLMHFEKDRVYLQCASCGHETAGWALTEPRPVVSARVEPRTVLQRPRLVSERRVA